MPCTVTIRLSLAVFDCSENENGVSTMDLEPSVECWSEQGDHAVLLPAGVVTLVLYGVGIPATIAYILWSHRHAIRADQALFAEGKGGTAVRSGCTRGGTCAPGDMTLVAMQATNPHIRIRKRFRKLYKDFRPSCMYWRLVLVLRKMVLALTMIMFNDLPLFQVRLCNVVVERVSRIVNLTLCIRLQATLSVTVLLLSYVMHSHIHPFLTAKPFDDQFVRAADGKLAFRDVGATAAAETAPSPSSPASRGSSGHDHGSPGSPAVRPSRLRLNSISEADGSAPNTPVAFARYRSSGSTLSSESGSLGALLVGGDGISSKSSPRASPAAVRPTARASVLVLASTKIAKSSISFVRIVGAVCLATELTSRCLCHNAGDRLQHVGVSVPHHLHPHPYWRHDVPILFDVTWLHRIPVSHCLSSRDDRHQRRHVWLPTCPRSDTVPPIRSPVRRCREGNSPTRPSCFH